MARPKTKSYKRVGFSLGEETLKVLDMIWRDSPHKSKSDFIESLIHGFYNINYDPMAELKKIAEDKKNQERKTEELTAKEKAILKRIDVYTKDQKQKSQKKIEAINILKRKFKEGFDWMDSDTQHIARTWAMRLGCSQEELLFLAANEIKQEASL